MNPDQDLDRGHALPSYSRRYRDPALALAYRTKFERSLFRRLSHWRERACVRAALAAAAPLLPPARQSGREPGPTILDLPCGAGRFAPLLAARAGRYVGADTSAQMLSLCAASLAAASCERELVVADARSIPLADRSVDLACCQRLLHHFPRRDDRAAILTELARVDRGPLVTSFLDAQAPKQWIHSQRIALAATQRRRFSLSRPEFAAEAHAAGWRVLRIWSLSGWFSGQCVALLVPKAP